MRPMPAAPGAARRYGGDVAMTRIAFSLDRQLAEQARDLGIDVAAAARAGVRAAIHSAMIESDREAYRRVPEEPDGFWDEAQAWV